VDPSALIFVALAVAWAVYLIPKALEHHEEGARSRTVDTFSDSVRVLARREPVSRREALLVGGDDPAPPTRREERRQARAQRSAERKEARLRKRNARRLAAAARIPSDPRARRRAAARAARRRLRVVTIVLAANAVVGILAAAGVFSVAWVLIPVGVLVAWLVACRLMVRRERAELPIIRRRSADQPSVETDADATTSIPAVADEPARDPDAWDPVDVPLPTYVSKPVVTRTVSTIDLDSTGVWTSGRSEADSALVRDQAPVAAAEDDDEQQRLFGS
jgi:hypothetical protein